MTIEETTSKIMRLLPSGQLRIEVVAHIRSQVHLAILTHTGQLQDKINDLDRELYLANIKIENGREEEVDSAGFNK
jgi:hypothetical protein